MNTTIVQQPKPWRVIENKNTSGTTFEADFPQYVPKLIIAFQHDCTVTEACDYAGVPRRTFYNHLNNDPVFAEEIRKAKDFLKMVAKNRVFDIITKGSDKDAGPMVRWFLEKREPEIYGPHLTSIQNTQQNNYFLTNEQINDLLKLPDIVHADPSELLDALET